MGRGLYAKTDFKTGDLVLVEKPCLIGPNFSNQFVFCSQCLAVAWTGIPCETCHDFIFCSLKCKNKAWKEHHHMECSLTPHLLLCDPEIPDYIFMSLKFIISLIKDNKAIDELKSKLKISKNNQVKIVNDKPEQKIDLFNKLMSLSHKLALDCSMRLTIHTVKILICMVKYSTFFSDKLKDMQYNDLSTNEDFMFIGSLLLRLVKINRVNNHDISDIAELSISQCLDIKAGRIDRSRGCCVGLISSMTNHSCVPNIRRCFSEDMKYIFYALEPIASGTQLLDAYGDFFYLSPLMHRREKRKNFVCQCIACEEDWPPVLLSPLIDEAKYFTELGFINEIVDVLPQPSTTRCLLLQALEAIYEKYYGLAVPFDNLCSF
ncbi:SET and MYND domain-containing protein DDB_G0273591-like [Trichogramma pretiosum]|uniref:SET and MYND domain-containing protein DDB_G0273591-like n=1 Tax=Trichogramma pretiosum TaxID=7493 RepID=UPI000C719FFA|nr:SET and MYND domain-containing protein DDB_G0273591-like [Trichogramma pretiosum]